MPKGGFWTGNSSLAFEPKRQFRFKVEIDGMAFEDDGNTTKIFKDSEDDPHMWYIKTVDKPSVSLSKVEGDQVKHGYQAPVPRSGGPIWKDITMTMVDPQYPNVTRKLMRLLRRGGYMDKQVQDAYGIDGFSITKMKETIGEIKIYQLDALGDALETWILYQAWPTEINFGKLDYSSDDFVEISVTWAYSYATMTAHGIPGLDSGYAMTGSHYFDAAGNPVMGERSFTYQRDGASAAPPGTGGGSGGSGNSSG